MIKTIYDNRRIISVIRKKVKPVSPSCFFLEQEKSNPVVKQVYVTKSGSLKIVDAGMLVMNWVSKKEFGAHLNTFLQKTFYPAKSLPHFHNPPILTYHQRQSSQSVSI